MEEDPSEIRVRYLIHLFENRSQKKSKDTDRAAEPAAISKRASEDVILEGLSSEPGKVTHHAAQDTNTPKATLGLSIQTSHTKNEAEERIVQMHRNNLELTTRETATHKEIEGLNRVKELEEQLKMRQLENDKLRNDLRAMSKKLDSMEFAAEKLKKEHEVQRKESAIQLNIITKKLDETTKSVQDFYRERDELQRAKDELAKERQSRDNHEKLLNEANAKIAELLKQVGEKEQLLLKNNDSSDTEKIKEELNDERRSKFALVRNLSIANEKVSTLGKQLEELEKQDHKESVAYRQMLLELSSEKRLRMECETRLNELKEELNNQSKAKENDAERDELISATLKELTEEKQARIEQEKLLSVTKNKLAAVEKQLEEAENELKQTKKDLAKEKLTKRNQEKLMSDANRKLSGLCSLLDDKQSQRTLNGVERDQPRAFGEEILLIPSKKHDEIDSVSVPAAPLTDFPDVSYAIHPLTNLRAGSQRPKRKKNHPVLSPVICAPSNTGFSFADSDSEE